MALDPVDADPSAAWRGSAVHAVLEAWMKEDDCDPAKLRARAEALLQAQDAHPLLRALWQPRLIEAIDFIADQVEANRAEGRRPLAAEIRGKAELAGVDSARHGRPDRPPGRRQPRHRRLQDRQPAERQGGRRGLFAAARPARPDRRARRLRRDRGRRRLLRILVPGARPALGPARLCEEPGRRAERARRGRFHRARRAQFRAPPRRNG